MIIEIEWLDAGLESNQIDFEVACAMNPMLRHNCGYLLQEDDGKVVIAFGSIQDKEHHKDVYDQCLVIPKGIIRARRILA